MANEEHWQKIVRFTALIISLIAIVFILKTLKGIFLPLVLAIFLSYLLAPPIELLAKIKIPRILSLFILLGIFTLIGTFGAQVLVNNIKDFIVFWPSLENRLFSSVSLFLKTYFNIETQTLFSLLQSQKISDLFSSFINLSVTFLGQFILTLIFLIFIYLTYHNYPRLIKKAFDRKKAVEIFRVLININKQIMKYIMIKTLISAGTGILTSAACAIFGIKFAVLWGFLAFLLNYIPYIGSFGAVIFPIVLSFFQFPHSYIPLVAALSLLIIQLVMGSYLDPEMMGNRFNLSPILIIVSLFFWSYVWGAVGAFLAVPIVAIIKIVVQNIESYKFVAVLMSRRAD